MKYLLTIIFISFFANHSQAQFDSFPKIEIHDLTQESFTIDSTATAVVLLEKGRTFIESSEADRAYMVFHHYKTRIKILKKEGYDQANFTIPLYKIGNTNEYIQNIKGTTYNLKDGRLNTTSLEQKSIFNENKSEYLRACLNF